MKQSRKMVYMSLLTSQALVLHYLEGLLPPLAPGTRLGLANIISLIALHLFGLREAMTIVVIRSVLGPILGGSPMGILYSLAGGTLSCIVMAVLYSRFNKYFSLPGISVAGAVFHNIGQILTASVVYGTIGILFTYLPVLMLSSVITGNFIGLAAKYIIRFLDRRQLFEQTG